MAKIKDQITKETWCKGAFTKIKADETVQHCLVGWIELVYTNTELHRLVYDLVATQIGSREISVWNDSGKRTYEEVKTLVDMLDI